MSAHNTVYRDPYRDWDEPRSSSYSVKRYVIPPEEDRNLVVRRPRDWDERSTSGMEDELDPRVYGDLRHDDPYEREYYRYTRFEDTLPSQIGRAS